MAEVKQAYLVYLRQKLVQYFSLDDIRTLCFDLDVDFDTLPGEDKIAKARELIIALNHSGRIAELVAICAVWRPNVDWIYSPPIAPPLPTSANAATILIIDDEADWRKIWKDTLYNEGYHLEYAPTVGEACDKLSEMHFDLVVTNLLLRDSFAPGWLAESTLLLDQVAARENLRAVIVTGTNERDSEVMYRLLVLQRDYPMIRDILFKRRCTTAELRKAIKQLLASPA
jgi:CheY-like chemotaxis protein